MSAILLFTPRNSVCLGFNIEKQSHTFQLSVFFFFFHLRKCISKVWRNRKEDWSSRKRVKSQVHDKLSSPAKDIFGRRYENNCCKYIDILHLYSSRGRSRGRVQGVHTPPPQDDLRFSNTTGILPKKKLCGLLVLK